MSPRQLRSRLLRNWFRERGSKSAHVFEVAAGEPASVRELGREVVRQAGDDFAAPALFVLALQDCVADPPVQHDHLRVDLACCLNPRSPHLRFDLFEQLGVSRGFDVALRRTHARLPVTGAEAAQTGQVRLTCERRNNIESFTEAGLLEIN